jgi:hypothetical protein
MSPTRNSFGEVTWSECSRSYLSEIDLPCLKDRTKKMPAALNHEKMGNYPGRYWDTTMQCQLLLKVRRR